VAWRLLTGAVIGVVSQAIAWHLRIPGIVLLLGVGVLLGPDVLGIVHPEALGTGLHTLVGYAVAIILFEGGLNLDFQRLRQESRSIQQLVTWGAVVTFVGGTLAAKIFMGWAWGTSILFGTLVIVTGPTVVTPLLKRLRVKKTVAHVLEAEGVIIDPIGAIVAVVALEVALDPSLLALGGFSVAWRLLTGAVIGVVGGALISVVLKRHHLIPEGLENIFVLSLVLAIFHGSNAVEHEAGIAAVTVAGIVVCYAKTPVQRDLAEFKEQLTVMLIGALFVLLAADVRIDDVVALGWPGVGVVAALMFIVRPLNILVGTWRTELTRNERLFMAWIGPRGIVAAAVASLFAARMASAGLEGGTELQALVFLVITVTVLSAGLTGGLVAQGLGLRRASNSGWLILGSNDFSQLMARVLSNEGEDVVFIDRNQHSVEIARARGLSAIYGNGLDDEVLEQAEADTRLGAIGMTPNGVVNLLFVQKVREEARLKHLYVEVPDHEGDITFDMVHGNGASVLFGRAEDAAAWSQQLRDGTAKLQRCRFGGEETLVRPGDGEVTPEDALLVAPLVWRRGSQVRPVGDGIKLEMGDEVTFVVDSSRYAEVQAHLFSKGWVGLDSLADEEEVSAE
jgi:NhaP-type Na+/H+ or K+/H+ antiporter